MTNEQKAKAYDEALEDMRAIYPNLKGDAKLAVEHAFPELTESDDERIREEMIRYFTEMKKGGSASLPYDDCIAYLEKQKERKPAEWSDEDEEMMADIIDSLEYAYPYSNEFRIAWLKSLRPQPKWKPTEEQIIAVKHAYNCFPNKCSTKSNLKRLYFDLKKLI